MAVRLPFALKLAATMLLAIISDHVSAATRVEETDDVRKVYRLLKIVPKSEIDASFLETIDSILPPFPAEGPYQIGDFPTIPGRYTVFKFIAVYKGRSFQGRKEFHDLLVIQTDGSGQVVEACHYTLEWTDVPSLDLYRFQGKKVVLKNNLNIRDLNLINVRTGETLSEEGIILLKD